MIWAACRRRCEPQLRQALDIEVVGQIMFEYADLEKYHAIVRQKVVKETEVDKDDDDNDRLGVAIACYFLLSRIADLAVRTSCAAASGVDERVHSPRSHGGRDTSMRTRWVALGRRRATAVRRR